MQLSSIMWKQGDGPNHIICTIAWCQTLGRSAGLYSSWLIAYSARFSRLPSSKQHKFCCSSHTFALQQFSVLQYRTSSGREETRPSLFGDFFLPYGCANAFGKSRTMERHFQASSPHIFFYHILSPYAIGVGIDPLTDLWEIDDRVQADYDPVN